MHIVSLVLRDFRNYREFSLSPARNVTVLVGPNAAGKTNALEAVCLTCTGSSFRRMSPADAVSWGAERTIVELTAEGETGPVGVRLDIAADGSRGWQVNGKAKRSASALAGIVPVVSFTPEDLGLVKAGAEARREALDSFGAMLSEVYGRAVRDYGRTLRQRNALLKDDAQDDLQTGAWDERLVETGARLTDLRRRLVARLAPHASAAYAAVGGEEMALAYESRTDLPEALGAEATAGALARALSQRRAEERARRVTLVGPHRDDVAFSVSGRPARAFASQGQQRTAVLAWKLAQVAVVGEVAGRTPVLLLDDVMSELDEARREALTALVQTDVQALITTANLGYFSEGLLGQALVVEVAPGG